MLVLGGGGVVVVVREKERKETDQGVSKVVLLVLVLQEGADRDAVAHPRACLPLFLQPIPRLHEALIQSNSNSPTHSAAFLVNIAPHHAGR